MKQCPKCGSENVDWITRIIDYAKGISKWSDPRKVEGASRYYDSKAE
jgi:ribonucleoside-triphosphate reductase